MDITAILTNAGADDIVFVSRSGDSANGLQWTMYVVSDTVQGADALPQTFTRQLAAGQFRIECWTTSGVSELLDRISQGAGDYSTPALTEHQANLCRALQNAVAVQNAVALADLQRRTGSLRMAGQGSGSR